jgi:hypothetical protein
MDKPGLLRCANEYLCLAVERVRDMDKVVEGHTDSQSLGYLRATDTSQLIDKFTALSIGIQSSADES